MNTPQTMNTPPFPQAEKMYQTLLEQLSAHCQAPQFLSDPPVLLGVFRGGAWIAERLHKDLGLSSPLCSIDISFYRDDFHTRGLPSQLHTTDIPIHLDGKKVILIDDVINSGRSVRAAINEIFEFGRPSSIMLAVLMDRGEREMPFQPDFVGYRGDVSAHLKIRLHQTALGGLDMELTPRANG